MLVGNDPNAKGQGYNHPLSIDVHDLKYLNA